MSKTLAINEKIRLIYNRVNGGDKKLGVYCWFKDKSEIEEETIKPYEFNLPETYLALHREFDGFSIASCDFLASRNRRMPTIEQYKELLLNWDCSKGYYPFAKDADGTIYTFSPHDQKIWMFEMGCFDEPPKLIADSFDAFMNDCVLGNRYLEFSFKEGNYFYDFLIEQGWVQE